MRIRDDAAPWPQHPGSKRLTGVTYLDRDSAKTLREAREIHHHASGAARSLANKYLEVMRLPTANHGCERALAHLIGSQHALEFRGFRDAGTPERHDDIADQQAGPGGRAIRLDVDNDDRRLLLEIQPLAEPLGQAHLLRAHTQVGSRDAPAAPQLVEHAVHRCGRDGELQLPRGARGVDSYDPPPYVDERSPREPRIERQIEAEELTADTPCCPSGADCAHDAPACTGPWAHRKHDVTDADGIRVG